MVVECGSKSSQQLSSGDVLKTENFCSQMPVDFTSKEREKISSQLEKNLSPEYLSVRTGYGSMQLTYVEGWLIISLANQIFGFDGWSSEIRSITEDYCETNEGKVSVGFSCCCRVTLKNGIYKEDVGFGSTDNQKIRGAAVEKAKKEAATDALKRALRQFGNALGNCCYDKEFLRDVHKENTFRKAKTYEKKDLLKKSDFKKKEKEISMSFDNDAMEDTQSL